jgi:hypothetical protein
MMIISTPKVSGCGAVSDDEVQGARVHVDVVAGTFGGRGMGDDVAIGLAVKGLVDVRRG